MHKYTVVVCASCDDDRITGTLRRMDDAFEVTVMQYLDHICLKQNEFDLLIIDENIIGFGGLLDLHIPIIVVSDANDSLVTIRAARCGCHDYLVHGQFCDEALKRAMLYAIERCGRELAEGRLAAIVAILEEFHISTKELRQEFMETRQAMAQLKYGHLHVECA